MISYSLPSPPCFLAGQPLPCIPLGSAVNPNSSCVPCRSRRREGLERGAAGGRCEETGLSRCGAADRWGLRQSPWPARGAAWDTRGKGVLQVLGLGGLVEEQDKAGKKERRRWDERMESTGNLEDKMHSQDRQSHRS